ncbi:PorP/SprF family type IX secretion system membrane protein [Rufibacter latericius]|uniref:Type IX secretion system membrane protein PorP/SprF n=1 Tax=Rufibacter latericius TaxID=2487040 RepID=A0A3M9MFA4_9BACT|nr:type IX secretion system membrane protein PorP/SprF [Rufibacter latericius]RNI23543.1 type IX secretion system membrane protein PorP/SprF [Rufibacter latericius]
MIGRKSLVAASLAFLCLVSWRAVGQQMPQFSQYMTNSLVINPAVAGIENYMDVRSSFRKQWVGVEGSPSTLYTSMHASIGKSDRNATGRGKFRVRSNGSGPKVDRNNRFRRVSPHHGVGAIVQIDQAGLLRTSSVNLVYSFHVPLTSTLNLSSGISAGVVRNSFNTSKARAISPSDVALLGDQVNMTKADLSVGTWLYTRYAFLGISGAHLINSGSDFQAPQDYSISGRLVPHYFITAGYRFQVEDLMITPSVLYKVAKSSPGAFDLNLKAMYNERVWVGASYRNKDAVAFLFGLNVSPILDFGYSYDLPISGQHKTSAGSHEVMVGLKVNNKLKVLCPQWVW